MSVIVDLPYKAEYAKSNRAGCKKCKNNIDKDSLRMAVMVQSPFFDGKVPNWFHYGCFFQQNHPKSIAEIKNFEHLRFEDQKMIEKSLNAEPQAAKDSGKKQAKKRKNDIEDISKEFSVEYSKSNKSYCKLCSNIIKKNEIRISKLDRESDDALKYGSLNRWFHVDCFRCVREELGFLWSVEVMNNFDHLDKNDQESLLKKFPPLSNNEAAPKDAKLPKKETEETKVSTKEEKQLKKQSDILFKYIEELKKLTRSQMKKLLEHNNILPGSLKNNERQAEFLADALAFGMPEKCPLCDGCVHFKIFQYKCYGNNNGWGSCFYEIENPSRSELLIPEDLKKEKFWSKYKYKPGVRLINQKLKSDFQEKLSVPSQEMSVKKEEKNSVELNKSLKGYLITFIGIKMSKKKIEDLGSTYCKNVDQNVLCVISTEDFLKKSKSKQIAAAKDLKIPVVSEKFLVSISTTNSLLESLKETKITFWDLSEQEIRERLEKLNLVSKTSSVFKSGSSLVQKSKNEKVVVENGAVVNAESGLQDVSHIYKEDDDLYDTVLNLVDLTANKNSYYKMQLLESDPPGIKKYWMVKKWGRIGTKVGDIKIEQFENKHAAKTAFQQKYLKLTHNEWKNRHNFVKKPFGYYPVEIDYGRIVPMLIEEEKLPLFLPAKLQDLIILLFDIEIMKKTMLEFDLDLEKIPLGKLSKRQILEACSVLKEISSLLEIHPMPINQLTIACNEFYCLVPHNFGLDRPPLIISQEVVSQKNEMLESLMEIELAYSLIDDKDSGDIYSKYKKLKANIEPIDENDKMFELIEKYAHNTHAKTHDSYTLQIVNIFRIDREGESERFQPFANNPNRMLLWHGSRLTNFAGIISQGLRISPEVAPSTGWMFGKGVYFADSVSKSANYCFTNRNSNIGLLALCEVALGESMDLRNCRYVEELPKEYLSVKGVGSFHPDPTEMITQDDGLKIPIGNMIPNPEAKHSSLELQYNEYVVYDEKQIRIKYLVQVNFHYKIRG